MSTVIDYHNQSMVLMNEAFLHQSGYDRCATLYHAMEWELEAARLCPAIEGEPSKAMLYIGSASLAMMAQDYMQALSVVEEGMTVPHTLKTQHDLMKLHAILLGTENNECVA